MRSRFRQDGIIKPEGGGAPGGSRCADLRSINSFWLFLVLLPLRSQVQVSGLQGSRAVQLKGKAPLSLSQEASWLTSVPPGRILPTTNTTTTAGQPLRQDIFVRRALPVLTSPSLFLKFCHDTTGASARILKNTNKKMALNLAAKYCCCIRGCLSVFFIRKAFQPIHVS